LPEMIVTGKKPKEIVREKGLLRISDEQVLKPIILKVFSEHKRAVHDALKDEKAINYLIGQVMKRTRGRADPVVTKNIIVQLLERIRKGENII